MHVPYRSLKHLVTLSLLALAVPAGRGLAAQTALARNADSTSFLTVANDSVTAVTREQREQPADAPKVGAPMNGLRSAVYVQKAARPFQPNAATSNANLGQATALMIVGGAAIIVGAVVDGDAGHVIMVGGALVGLYGLYEYLK